MGYALQQVSLLVLQTDIQTDTSGGVLLELSFSVPCFFIVWSIINATILIVNCAIWVVDVVILIVDIAVWIIQIVMEIVVLSLQIFDNSSK